MRICRPFQHPDAEAPEPSYKDERERSKFKKRRERAAQRKREALPFRIIDGLRHPIPCPCYDCLWTDKA